MHEEGQSRAVLKRLNTSQKLNAYKVDVSRESLSLSCSSSNNFVYNIHFRSILHAKPSRNDAFDNIGISTTPNL